MSRTAPPLSVSGASKPQQPSADALKRRRRRLPWDETPLRTKAHAIVVLIAVGGLLVGTLEAGLGYKVWPMMIGLSLLMLVGCALVNWWIGLPLDRLIAKLERVGRSNEALSLRRLPVTREDELGRIARAVHRLGESLRRQQHETTSLRRTMEDRAAEATRRATMQLERLAMRDPLTDLGNRRCLDENLDRLIAIARADRKLDLMCILIDVDNFKALNDTLGHAAGDEVLAFLGSVIRGCTRDNDIAVRFGGDEFVVLLPLPAVDRAEQFSQLVQTLFRQQTRTRYPNGPAVDLSIGIAGLKRDQCSTSEALLAKADENLYKAKRAGKGRTVGGQG